MKNFFIILLLLCVKLSNAQHDINNTFYSSMEFNIGNYYGLDVHLNYVFKEKYTIKAGYSSNLRKPQSQPQDFSSGVIEIILLNLPNPRDHLETFQIGLGKIYNLNQRNTIRAHVSLGIGFTVIKEPENWERINTGVIVSNYNWNYKKKNSLSLIINPKIEFPIKRLYGLTISPLVHLNKDRTYYGVGIGQMIGILRKRTN